MGPATGCPSARLGLCKIPAGKCYALKAERQYKQVLPYRRKQWAAFHTLDRQYLVWSIEKQITRSTKYIRFSESGDFYSQTDVDKVSYIVNAMERHGIKVYGYTARRDLDFSRISSNMTVTGSGFMIHNNFKAVKALNKTGRICPGDCRRCDMCKTRKGVTIQALYH